MTKASVEDRLVELRLRKAELEKEFQDRENLEKGVRLVDNPRPIALRRSDDIRKELNTVLDEIDNCEKALSIDTTSAQGTEKGELKERVTKWAEAKNLTIGKTVPSGQISKLVRDLKKEGIETSDGAVRTILSRLGYSAERKGKDAS